MMNPRKHPSLSRRASLKMCPLLPAVAADNAALLPPVCHRWQKPPVLPVAPLAEAAAAAAVQKTPVLPVVPPVLPAGRSRRGRLLERPCALSSAAARAALRSLLSLRLPLRSAAAAADVGRGCAPRLPCSCGSGGCSVRRRRLAVRQRRKCENGAEKSAADALLRTILALPPQPLRRI